MDEAFEIMRLPRAGRTGHIVADFVNCAMRSVVLRPISMQDIRLAVGEGELSASDVLAGCNVELLRRSHLMGPRTSSDLRNGEDRRVSKEGLHGVAEIVTLRIQVLDPTALFIQARTAFLKVGSEENVETTLGCSDVPNLRACIVELIAEQDQAGIFDFPD